ncbi:MAG: lipoprotein-releasing system ATP-binding protein LolD [Candidatus Hydrothermota bacterium]|nr:MAG: lipoprotein-releasing system ATP-binding protein LolD [Candidatus Hydrothermae bacterium]
MIVIELKDIEKIYVSGKYRVKALRGIDLQISKGEFTAVVGPSGSGKTTLLNIMGCIDLPTRGSVTLHGEELQTKKPEELALLRRNYFGFIFQSFNLIPVLTVYENVEIALKLRYKNLQKKEREKRILSILEAVGLSDKWNMKPLELSGGEQQRVSIARALVKDPEFVLADEPTANLDSETGKSIVELMRKLNAEKGVTFVFSTHDPLIVEHAKRIIKLRDGKIVGE